MGMDSKTERKSTANKPPASTGEGGFGDGRQAGNPPGMGDGRKPTGIQGDQGKTKNDVQR